MPACTRFSKNSAQQWEVGRFRTRLENDPNLSKEQWALSHYRCHPAEVFGEFTGVGLLALADPERWTSCRGLQHGGLTRLTGRFSFVVGEHGQRPLAGVGAEGSGGASFGGPGASWSGPAV